MYIYNIYNICIALNNKPSNSDIFIFCVSPKY